MRYDPISEKHFSLKDSDEMTTVWGFDKEDDAWAVIDEQMRQDDIAEYDSDRIRITDPGREDFHADG